MTKCKVIALANQKGGTAKTATTLNLGIGLAHQGRKVLLVDADLQGDLTTALGWTNADNFPITLDTQMKKILQDEPFVYNEGILHHEEGVDIMPTNIELSGMEISLVNAMSREQTLKLYLADLKKDYDYILIDCMPSFGMLTINALAAADSVIAPVQAHYLPLKGIPAFEVVVSRNKVTIDLGTLTDEYEKEITIHTTATDKNGKKEIEAGKGLTIVDTVTLEGMEIGTNYKLSGWQMVKAENAKLLIDGKEVTNDYEFTADKENMEVQIEFTFDGSTLGRKQLVTFEELYDITNSEEPKKVTEHKEINDEGQTVTIKEVPETPTPETPGTTTKTSNPPKTGDTANVILWIAILVLSAAGITGVRIWNKKKQVKRLGIEEKEEEEE
ncbi:MAG: AAA family ATPase [Lachnospiraceae bacterium]